MSDILHNSIFAGFAALAVGSALVGLLIVGDHQLRQVFITRIRLRREQADSAWVLAHRSRDSSTEVYNKDGVSWDQAPLPHRWHLCDAHVQTRGTYSFFFSRERCACGAIRRLPDGRWCQKNERRKSRFKKCLMLIRMHV